MGLYDGRSSTADEGSTAQMAKLLGAPVALVADASAMARSAAALIRGFEDFEDAPKIGGVLFNRIGGQRHAGILGEATSRYCRAVPLGFLPRDESVVLPERHLGLTLAAEALTPEILARLVAWVENHVDLDRLLAVARTFDSVVLPAPPQAAQSAKVRIGVARDAAFCFYYQDNLDLLRRCGATLVEFSPLADGSLPRDLSGLYIGGGYPELHAGRLAENIAMRDAIREFIISGAPVYSECGGLMFLSEAIADTGGRCWPMIGVFPTVARMRSRLARLGYIEVETAPGELARGHQFRYSDIDPLPENIQSPYADTYQIGEVTGSYVHLHFLSCPGFAQRFVDRCSAWRSKEFPQ